MANQLSNFGKKVKKKLIDKGLTDVWLSQEVNIKTGLKTDSAYIGKILRGKRKSPKVIQAIQEILGL